MKKEYSDFLIKLAKDYGMPDLPSKKAFLNPLANDMFARLLSGALKGLETVALASFDFKLTAIVKLLQAWMTDKRNEIEKERQQTQFGAGSYTDNNVNFQMSDPFNPSNFF